MSKPNIYDLEFSKRMESLIDTHGKSLASFAEKIGVTAPSVKRWVSGESDPTRSNLIKIAEATNVSVEWLVTGMGERKNDEESLVSRAFNRAKEMINDSVAMIPSFSSIRVSAGFGSFNEGTTKPDGEEPYAESLLSQIGIKAEKCAVFWVNGNSMQPTINNGDQLLVDLSRKEIKGDNIYLVQNGDSVWVKRVKIKWDVVELISDNREEYEPIKIPMKEARNLQVIGQVVHIGHKLI